MAKQINPSPTGFPVELSPSAIERELASMWDQREANPAAGNEANSSGITHFTLGNIVWFGSSRFLPRIRKIFSELVNTYPCRLFLLEFTEDPDHDKISAYTNAYCYRSSKDKGEVCCEEIHLLFSERYLEHIKGVMLPLLVADVPTYFWYFSSMPTRYKRLIPDLKKLADITINEVAFLDDPAEGMRAMSEKENESISLSWYRCMPLREYIARFFDDPKMLPLINEIQHLEFGWCGNSGRTQAVINACGTVGWMADKLGWEYKGKMQYLANGKLIQIAFKEEPPSEGPDCSQITSVKITYATGDYCSLNATRCEGQTERKVHFTDESIHDHSNIIRMHTLSEAEALTRLVQSPQSRHQFAGAAKKSWILVRDTLDSFQS